MLFDTHAHLQDERFSRDLPDVFDNAKNFGVELFLNASYDLESSDASILLASKHSNVYAAIGIHPHDAKTIDQNALDKLERDSAHPKVVAIGEIGLDYYRDLSPRNLQRAGFIAQIQLAKRVKKPIIVHNRDSNADSVAIIKEHHAGEFGGIIHSFSGDLQMLKDVIDEGFHISISGPVTYSNSDMLKQIAKTVPLNRLLLETDCPYLPPVPFRGKRNEPAYVKLVCEEIARLRGISPDEIADATTANAKRLFGIS